MADQCTLRTLLRRLQQSLPERARRLAEEGTKVTGVTASKDKFVARINFEGKQVQLGTFASRRHAIERRLRAEEDVAAGRHPKAKEDGSSKASKKSAPVERLSNELPNDLLPEPVSSLDSTEIRELAIRLAEKRPAASGSGCGCHLTTVIWGVKSPQKNQKRKTTRV